MSWSLLLFLCAVLIGVVNGVDNLGFDEVSTLTELNTGNFDSHVYADDKPWAVVFFAPWCIWSERLAPKWKKISNDLQDIVHMGYVNTPENRPLGRRFKIKKYPSIYMFFGDKSSPEKFQGKRTEERLTNAFMSGANSRAKREESKASSEKGCKAEEI